MPESELKLETPCPRCGTANLPSAQRCRQCFYELPTLTAVRAPDAGAFDWPRATTACVSCGKPIGPIAPGAHVFDVSLCAECDGAATAADPEVDPISGERRLRSTPRTRRRASVAGDSSWLNLAWLLRLSSVLFLFWGVIDTSIWLTNTTRSLAPGDPAGLRYSVFAIYELVRDLCIVAGIWLLTLLNPRREK